MTFNKEPYLTLRPEDVPLAPWPEDAAPTPEARIAWLTIGDSSYRNIGDAAHKYARICFYKVEGYLDGLPVSMQCVAEYWSWFHDPPPGEFRLAIVERQGIKTAVLATGRSYAQALGIETYTPPQQSYQLQQRSPYHRTIGQRSP